MWSGAGNSSSKLQSWGARLTGAFGGSSSSAGSDTRPAPGEVLPPEQRKAAMSTLDQLEIRWSLGAFVLAAIGGIAIPAYIIATNKLTKEGKDTIAVAPDAKLLGGAILLLCVIGFLALWKRKRTLVTFDLFLIGFAFTLFIGLAGFAFIVLGGWLMLRAWRINKYGTTNAKTIAKEAAARPRGRERKEVKTSSKAGSSPTVRKPPTASKRYTPKSPPRKKIPKPTE
jgi:hypothetical protein